ncbi:MAG: cobalamin-dependent protein [Deltaproteobacteria bacterium]|nr:cobalamin-dependent protein [Deltaproteobacteria bacterium]
MKVLLISPNSLTTPYPVYPLGLDYVADAIRDDHEVRIVDVNPLSSREGLVEAIQDYVPDMVGISLRNIDNTDGMHPTGFMGDYAACMETVRKYSRAPVVLGGSGFTLFPQEIMKTLGAEYGIVGEGEKLNPLLKTLEAGGDAASIPGIVTRDAHEALSKPLDRAVVLNYTPEHAQVAYYLKHGGMLNLQTKRGCPFGCIYCTYPRIEGSRLRRVSPEAVAERALKLEASGARYFFVTDSAFNADVEHSTRVAEAFMDAGVTIPWGRFLHL